HREERLRAQRLSASTDQSLFQTVLTMEARLSAQRLSASTDQSPRWHQCVRCRFEVLNAFRHQRINHIPKTIGLFSLNCAQRLSASTDQSPARVRAALFARNLCSTPFGINGSITRQPRDFRELRPVCSTPFGINGSITIIPLGREAMISMCSTPF